MDHISVRDATAADAPVLAEIHVAAWRAAYRGLMPDDYLASLSVEQRTHLWIAALSRPGPAKLAIAELDGGTAGFCSFGPTRDDAQPDVAELYAINIDPRLWRRGAGRALCEHALRQAAGRECSAITLWVLKGNAPARQFYERLGYAPDGAERTNTRLVGSPLHEIRYRKAIAPKW